MRSKSLHNVVNYQRHTFESDPVKFDRMIRAFANTQAAHRYKIENPTYATQLDDVADILRFAA